MANKKIKKPLTQRVSIYEQEYELRLKAKELLKKCKITTNLERIEVVIKYYYDRGTNREKCNEIKRKLLKYETTVSTEE